MTVHNDDIPCQGACMTRRALLFHGVGAATGTVLLCNIPGCKEEAKVPAVVTRYPAKLIGKLSTLKTDEPMPFQYPDEGDSSVSMLIKLRTPAGGGIGPGQDVVAFNMACPHMGGPLFYTYQAEEQALGPCPNHLSSFDLTRHGMIIAGHATESLPQVLLELRGDDIYAVGLIGLIYGRHDNLKA